MSGPRRLDSRLVALLALLCACHGHARPAGDDRPVAPTAPPAPPAAPPPAPAVAAEALRQLDDEQQRSGSDRRYLTLRQRSQDGDRRAQLVLQVVMLRDGLRNDCPGEDDRQAFAAQVEVLELRLQQAGDNAAEWIYAGPTLLLGLQHSGRGANLPAVAARVLSHARQTLTAATDQQRLGELLADTAHALRLGCRLQDALPLLEEAVRLLAPGGPTLSAQLALRDLGTLRFLLGDAPGAQRALDELQQQLSHDGQAASGGAELNARREIVTVLRTHLVDAGGTVAGPPPPRETGPGWQALREVQEQASCPQASPANPRFLRVPVQPPACAPRRP